LKEGRREGAPQGGGGIVGVVAREGGGEERTHTRSRRGLEFDRGEERGRAPRGGKRRHRRRVVARERRYVVTWMTARERPRTSRPEGRKPQSLK